MFYTFSPPFFVKEKLKSSLKDNYIKAKIRGNVKHLHDLRSQFTLK